jgi:nucleoside 2-deoxyribosyltransferase
MKKLKVYLAGPIAGCSDGEANDWRDGLIQNYGSVVDFINPMDRDYRGIEGDHTNEIVDLDKRDIQMSDVILAYAPKPTVGTSMEILYAHGYEIPSVVVIPEGPKVSPWIRRHATKVLRTFTGDAMEWILDNVKANWEQEIAKEIAAAAREAREAALEEAAGVMGVLADPESEWDRGWSQGMREAMLRIAALKEKA